MIHFCKLIVTAITVYCLTSNLYGQASRNNYHALLELDDVILHGAGQSPDAFESYFDYMPKDNKPIIYMYYLPLNGLNSASWIDDLKNELEKYSGQYLIPQIGLSMSPGDNPGGHYEQDVAAGFYDEQIGYLVEGFKKLGRPAFLRIGYEFNGTAWNGYADNSYIQAYKRITDSLRYHDLEVATVWCAAVGEGTDGNYINYYPGNDYVDWWGIDLFSASQFTDDMTKSFMINAHNHNKPVMIGESTPRYVGANDNSDWKDWFLLYFNFIENNPGVKAFCYINWNWAEYPQWADWGNAQLSQNEYVRVNYVYKIRDKLFYHSATQKEFRTALNYNDNTPPEAPVIAGTDSNELPITVRWNPVIDESGVVYVIYKDSVFYSTTCETVFVDHNYFAGDSFKLQVSVMDRAGNESERSNILEYHLSDTVCKTLNPAFKGTIYPWSLASYNGSRASFQLQEDALKVRIDSSTSTNWHIQMVQNIEVIKENKYYIETTARSSQSGSSEIILQQSHTPYVTPIFQKVNLQISNSAFNTGIYNASENDNMNVGFFLGELNSGNTVIIDSFKLFEINGIDGLIKNTAPVSEAGDNFSYLDPGSNIELNGSGSFDSDGSITTYQWEQLSGQEVITITDPVSAITSLTDLKKGTYVFRLKVIDNQGGVSFDEVVVSIDTLPADNPTYIINEINEYPINIRPNPTSELIQFCVNGLGYDKKANLIVMDLKWKIVIPEREVTISTPDELISIDVSDLESGMYTICITVNERKYIGKFIVN